MKITIKYEEGDDKAVHMTLRLTLPQKYLSGPTKALVKLFVDHYNKKHASAPLDAEALHIKVVGGEHLDREELVSDSLKDGTEVYLMDEEALRREKEKPPAPKAQPAAASAPAKPASGSKEPVKDEQGRIRCKRFGCQKWYDPDGPPQECQHHKAPPIFHETAKWWSCCPDRKAYDWEEFMRIPGCEKGFCSNVPEQGGKRFLGGCDLRGDSAPVRIDADAPRDPRKKLADLRLGLIAIGVDGALFDKVCEKLAAETGDVDKICDKLRSRFASVLNRAGG
eukprot:TRINITY_DN15536_c0_g1_i1.p1 TRINITY_DN15536_c0_g1~~TRINITY_DN15536_c0_g1_i1.p1  ORF type:complete len:280 (-),score=59.07 TRINITY_DN15536_c0_g1_i1:91-930(-)